MTASSDDRHALLRLVTAHESYRSRSLNLIASENVLSPAVMDALRSDLIGRYADYRGMDLTTRRYTGNRHIVEIEQTAGAVARRVLGADHVELRPLGGHLAGVALLLAVCRPGDLVLEIGREGGGHRMAGRMVTTTFDLEVHALPFNGPRFNVDVAAAIELVHRTAPRLVILGSSNFLFPHPVAELAAALPEGTLLAYDASHVMGFLAAGRFQDPLGEGADIVFGSTHKTLPGPQGGIIFTNESDLMERVTDALVPSLVTNHHTFRIPALALSLLEMERWGPDLCDRITANANALGAALEERGVRCVQAGGQHTKSHTVLLSVAEHGPAEPVARRLEGAGIMSTSALLPEHWGAEGIRFGVQEVTRLGADEALMDTIADAVAGLLRDRRTPTDTRAMVEEITGGFGDVGFTWDEPGTGHRP